MTSFAPASAVSPMSTEKPLIRVAHSPDSDDAFMFYALAQDKIDTEGLRFEHVLCDIEALNHEALKGTYELTAISYHAYPYLADKYVMLDVGASIGDKYGPVLISQEPMTKDDLVSGKFKDTPIAVPGLMTSAYLGLKLWEPSLNTVVVPFDQIMERVASGEFKAGLIIHEGQLTYGAEGFHKVVDLGEWWFATTNLPLPLGCNAIRRDLGAERIAQVARLLKQSIQYSLDHREAGLAHAMQYSRGLTTAQADQFVGMYVNHHTIQAGAEVKRAVRLMLAMGADMGIIPNKVEPEFVDAV